MVQEKLPEEAEILGEECGVVSIDLKYKQSIITIDKNPRGVKASAFLLVGNESFALSHVFEAIFTDIELGRNLVFVGIGTVIPTLDFVSPQFYSLNIFDLRILYMLLFPVCNQRIDYLQGTNGFITFKFSPLVTCFYFRLSKIMKDAPGNTGKISKPLRQTEHNFPESIDRGACRLNRKY
jgi:hypothetical protein